MVSFIHTADLHLGMRITRFPPEIADRIREARLTALDNVLKAATEQKVDFVVVAGDLFDDLAVAALTARRAFEMLEAAVAPVFVLPGNHDPLQSGGVWDRPPWDKVPGKRVCLLRNAEPFEVEPGLVLLPCPVLRKTSLQDPTTWIAQSPITNGAVRIGIAHGSLRVREDLPADDHLIARHAVGDGKLDYLALGHWHSRRLYPDPDGVERTAYCGVHEPMRFMGSSDSRTGWVPYGGAGRDEFLDAGKGEVLHVRIRAPGTPPEIESVEVGQYLWQEEQRDLASVADLGRLIGDVATREKVERRLLRLKVTGVLDAAAMLQLDELREILTKRYLLGELDDAGLHVQPTEDEARAMAGQGVLREVLAKLQAETQTTDPAGRRIAERALLLLYQIAREASA